MLPLLIGGGPTGQTDILRGQGIALDRSTLLHWVIRAAWWLKPLYTLLVDSVTIRHCQCWTDDDDEHEPDGSGRTRSMIDLGKGLRCRRWSTSLRRIEKGGTFMSI